MKIMKAKCLLGWLVMMVLLTCFCSCNDDDKGGAFEVGKSDVFVMMDNKDNIPLFPLEGNYKVKSLDESIATGEIKKTDNGDASVVVTPVSKGKTTFVISNGIEEKEVDITVVNAYIVFNVERESFLCMADKDKNDVIMAELKKDPFLGPKNVFMLVKDEAQTMYLFDKKEDIEVDETFKSVSKSPYKSKGSYDILKSGDKFYLVLEAGSRSSRFEIGGNAEGQSILKSFFNLNSLKSENTVPEQLAQIDLTEDLTEEYHNKFQGGISSVEHGYTCTILSERMYRLPFEE